MRKKEANFTTKFLAWARDHLVAPAVFEVKSTRGHMVFPVFELRKHQRDSLLAASKGHFVYKIPDSAIGYKPFDAVLFGNMEAYVVIEYPNTAFLIPIEHMPTDGSLSTEEARTIASAEITV